jgi:hypothetical protein
MKIVTKVLLLIIIVLVILTVLVYNDMTDLRKGFAANNNTFLLYENNQLYSAITLKPMTSINLSMDSFSFFTKEELASAEAELNNKSYDALLTNNFRVFILKPIILNKPYKINLGIELNEGDLLEIIMSDKPFTVLATKANTTYHVNVAELAKGFEEIYGSEEKLKGYLFGALLANYFQFQTPGELVKNIKEKRIMIYPETISFKIISYLP